MIRRFFISAISLACFSVPSLKGAAIQLVDIFKNISYTQSSGAAPSTPTGFFADVELTSQNAGDFTNVIVTYPGPGSPLTVPQVSPTFFKYGPGFATQAAMNAAIPFGAYKYTATNTAVNQTATLNYTTDAFTGAIPALNASSFNALHGLNPTTALTIGFNSFTPNAAASQGFTFFTIFGSSGTVFSGGFLGPSATSVLLPANTLAPNTNYSFELDFSDRINGSDPSTGVFTLVGSDVRTDGTFTTGPSATVTPEPGTLLLAGCGVMAVAILRKRRNGLDNL
jgi:PEP-CTERM motif